MNLTKKSPLLISYPVLNLSFLLLSFLLLHGSCQRTEKNENSFIVNTAHLDTLYGEISVEGVDVGYVHIYSEFPDYHMVGDGDEGFACVDDASRAAIFYFRQFKTSADPEHLRKAEMLLKFLLAMQDPNGYYYNFIWPDGSIHKDGVTTKAHANWWSWRVLWAFGEAMEVPELDTLLVQKIGKQRELLVRSILREPSFMSEHVDTIEGLIIPTWLPRVSGADQASTILIGLSMMMEKTSKTGDMQMDSLIAVMRHFADGIVMMQVHAPDSLQDGAFLSWANLWHAYGNTQAYALLKVSQVLGDSNYAAHALYEINHFYPAVLEAGGLESFWVHREDDDIVRYKTQVFSQIAYGKRPMIFACVEAFKITGDDKYLLLATDIAKWFAGENKPKTIMYDPGSGRGYDGIIDAEQINKNAGAESTIEALLSIQALAKYANEKQ